VQRTYIQNNYTGFNGERSFVRDEDAQKAFSKLRSSQAGMYAWRCGPSCPPEYREQTTALQEALRRETDFAFKQAFAFCPYSPEAVFRYVQFLMQYNRIDDALLVAKTCLKLDPYNGSVADLIDNLEKYRSSSGQRDQVENQLQTMENEAQKNPTNYQNIFSLAGLYLQLQQTNRADDLLLQAVTRPNPSVAVLRSAAEFFAQTANFPDLEITLRGLATADPNIPETWYDLSRLELMLGKRDEALKDLGTCVNLSNARLKTNPGARDLRNDARNEPSFNSVRNTPEFQKLVSP
jgi:tetratricopeptide (TPR) repeat protein